MGYSEIYCALCGISFNIGRIRTANEPEEAAWTTWGPAGWVDPLGHDNEHCSTEKTGCFYVVRNCEGFRRGISEGMKADLWSFMFFEYEEGKAPQVGDRLPMAEPIVELDGRIGFRKQDLEHIAGPKCNFGGGYMGYRVSAEEMRSCQTAQCLAPKPANWQPQPGDCQAELESKYFLTGLVDGMPDIEMGTIAPSPARHGVVEDLFPMDPFGCCYEDEFNVPAFHPSCFAIFMKLSCLRFGRVEIDGLMSYFAEADKREHEFTELFIEPEVAVNCDQWWNHIQGTEWLAVNPLYVPRLREIFEAAMNTDPGFSQHDSAFKSLIAGAIPSSDHFTRLPSELRTMILDRLRPKDIASLRLASRTFYNLPISLFHRLVCQEMPWLWESWEDEPPYFWATVTERDIRANGILENPTDRESRIVGHTINVKDHLRQWTLPKPSVSTTNWYLIYRDIRKHWNELRGLRNRQRIWKWQSGIIDELAEHLEQKKSFS